MYFNTLLTMIDLAATISKQGGRNATNSWLKKAASVLKPVAWRQTPFTETFTTAAFLLAKLRKFI